MGLLKSIMKIRLFKYIENFSSKIWKFSDKILWYFHISAENIDCGYSLEPPRRGGSNEYHNLCFWAEIKKSNVCSCKFQFYYIKVGFKGSKLYRHVFVMGNNLLSNVLSTADQILSFKNDPLKRGFICMEANSVFPGIIPLGKMLKHLA